MNSRLQTELTTIAHKARRQNQNSFTMLNTILTCLGEMADNEGVIEVANGLPHAKNLIVSRTYKSLVAEELYVSYYFITLASVRPHAPYHTIVCLPLQVSDDQLALQVRTFVCSVFTLLTLTSAITKCYFCAQITEQTNLMFYIKHGDDPQAAICLAVILLTIKGRQWALPSMTPSRQHMSKTVQDTDGFVRLFEASFLYSATHATAIIVVNIHLFQLACRMWILTTASRTYNF